MKRAIIAFACMLFCTMHLSAQTVDDLFKEFKNKENVEYVEIPKVMMSMASGLVKKEDGGDLVKKINHVRILSIEDNPTLSQEFSLKASNLKKKGYEEMVNSNEENEKTLILVKSKGEAISEMVILVTEPSECSLIQLKGKLKPSDVNNLSGITDIKGSN